MVVGSSPTREAIGHSQGICTHYKRNTDLFINQKKKTLMSIAIETVTHESYVVDGKTYKTKEAAEAAIAALENVQIGLEFVAAQYPELSERGARTKANLIGEYLDWIEDRKSTRLNSSHVRIS